MAERNYVARVSVGQEAIFDLNDLYRVMYSFFERYGYDWLEKDYREFKGEGGNKKAEIVWWVERKVDDYTKFVMEITFKIEAKEISVKKQTRYDGKITIKFDVYLLNDYEDSWSKTPISKFARETYDKFIASSHFSRLEGDLKNEMQSLIDEIKAFLRMHKNVPSKN